MSKKIDQRIVEMSFENHKFEKGIKESQGSLKEFSNALKNMDPGKSFEGLDRSVNSVSSSFSMLEQIGIGALRRIGEAAVNAGGRLVKSLSIDQLTAGLSKYQEKIEAVQTMVSAGYNLSDVEESMQQLMWFSDETSYSFSDMANNMAKFIAAGVDLQTSERAMKGIANWAAHSGKNTEAASIAMFNLSQAISMGYVDTLNWRSIMGQNMNTVMFKEIAIGVAEAVGAVEKGQITIQNFDSDLKKKWFTNEVLLQTLEQYSLFSEKVQEVQENMHFATAQAAMDFMDKNADDYADVIDTIGYAAFKAAQESKSFADSINATKDAVSSGWMKTYEILFGTLNEAKKNFSAITEMLYTIFAAGGEVRNALLFETLRSGWEQFTSEGIKDTETFGRVLGEVASEAGIDIVSLIEKYGSMEEAVQDNFVTGNMLIDTVNRMADSVENLSDEELANIGYTKKTREKLLKLRDALLDGSISADEFAEKFGQISGISNLVQGLKNSAVALLKPLKAISEAFDQFFPPMTSSKLYNLIESFKDFTASLIITDEVADKIQRTFAGFFAIVDIGWQTVKFFGSALLEVVRTILPFGDGFLSVTASIGDFLVAINHAIKASGIFQYGLLAIKIAAVLIRNALANIVGSISNFINGLMSAEDPLAFIGELLTKVFGGMVDSIKMGVSWLTKNFIQALTTVRNFMTSKFLTTGIFGEVLTILRDVMDFIINVATGGIKDFGEVIKGLDLNKIATFVIGGTLLLFVNQLTQLLKAMTGIINTTNKFTTAISKKLFDTTTKIKDLAYVIGILSASLFILSHVPWDKLKIGLAGLGIAMGIFITAYGSIQAINVIATKVLKGQEMIKSALNLVSLATGLSIMAVALKIVSSINDDEISRAVNVLGSLVGFLAGYQIAMGFISTFAKGNKVASVTGLATGILLLIGVIKIINGVSDDDINAGMNKVSNILLALAGIQFLFSMAAYIGGGAKLSTSVLSLATGVLLLIGVIKIINKISIGEILAGMAKVTLILGAIAGIEALFGKAAVIGKGAKLSISILSLIATVGTMMALIKVINLMSSDEILLGTIKIGFMMAMLAAVQALFATANNIGKSNVSLSILGTIASLTIMTGLISILNIYTKDQILKGLGVMLAMGTLLGAIQFFMAVSAAISDGNKAVASIFSISVLLAAMAGVIALLSIIPEDSLKAATNAMINAGIAIGLLILAITAFSLVAQGSIPQMLGLGATLVIFAAAIGLLAIPLMAISNINFTQLMSGVVALGILVGLFGGMALILNSLGVGTLALIGLAGALVLFGGALILVSAAMTALASFDSQQIKAIALAFAGLLAVFTAIGFLNQTGGIALGMVTAAAGVAAFGASLIVVSGAIALAAIAFKLGAEAIDIMVTAFGNLLAIVQENRDTMVNDFIIIGEAIGAGIFAGIKSFFDHIGEELKNVWSNITNSVKSFFGIKSPSTLMIEVGSEISEGLWNGLKDGLLSIPNKIGGYLTNITNTISSVVGPAVTTGKNLAVGLGNGIKDGAVAVFTGAKNMATGVLNRVNKVFESHSPSKAFEEIGSWLPKGLAKGIGNTSSVAALAGINMAEGLEEAIRDTMDIHSVGFKWPALGGEVPSQISLGMEWMKHKALDTAENLGIDIGNITTDSIADSLEAGEGKVTTALGSLMELLQGKVSLGEFTEGLGGGLSDLFSGSGSNDLKKATKSSGGIVKDAFQLFKEEIDELREYDLITAWDAILRWDEFSQKYAEGSKIRLKADKELARLRYEYSTKWIDEEKYYKRLSLQEELEAWERVQQRYKEGHEYRLKAEREIFRLKQEINQFEYQSVVDLIEEEKYYGRMNLSQELSKWKSLINIIDDASDERKKADREIYRLEKEINEKNIEYEEQLLALEQERLDKRLQLETDYYNKEKEINNKREQDIKNLTDTYESALESRTNTLYSTYGLFDKVDKPSYVSGFELINNLEDQVMAFEKWQSSINTLAAKGVDEGLIKELRDMGPKSLSQIKALNRLSEPELERYVTLWQKKSVNAKNQALDELQDLKVETDKEIKKINKAADAELKEYNKIWQDSLKQLNKDNKQQLNKLEEEWKESIGGITSTGLKLIQQFRLDWFGEISAMVDETKAQMSLLKKLTSMKDSIEPVAKAAGTASSVIGAAVGTGMASGVSGAIGLVASAGLGMASVLLTKVKSSLDVKSPSKEFMKIGRNSVEGLVIGLHDLMDSVQKEGSNIGKTALDAVSGSMGSISDLMDGNLEEFTIRPVLDLSEVRTGINDLDSIFGNRPWLNIGANMQLLPSSNGTNYDNHLLNEIRDILRNTADQEVDVSGVLTVEVTNDKGEIIGITKAAVKDMLRRESR